MDDIRILNLGLFKIKNQLNSIEKTTINFKFQIISFMDNNLVVCFLITLNNRINIRK